MPKRFGVMGGTFDPIHIGHLRIAEEAMEEMRLDRVLFIPAADPPHKPGGFILPFEHRWRMLELSVRQNPKFRLSDLEKRLSGKSYTVKSLRRLIEEYQEGIELFFLVGLDAFLEMDTWWRFRELFELAHMVVLQRPGYGEADVREFLTTRVSADFGREHAGGRFDHPSLLSVHCLSNTRLDISSTRIRQLIHEGRSIRYLVPHEVLRYIVEHKIYSTAVAAPFVRKEEH
jgi:nicotinate-nucleotide adenylyltransferase